jgi:hypothetical protein
MQLTTGMPGSVDFEDFSGGEANVLLTVLTAAEADERTTGRMWVEEDH